MEPQYEKREKPRKKIKALYDESVNPKDVVEARQAEILKSPDSLQHQPTYWEAFREIKAEDFTTTHHAACNREAYMYGIGAGTALGGLRFLLRASPTSATLWAGWGGIAAAIGMHQVCQWRARMGRETIRIATQKVKEEKERRRLAEEQKQREIEAERISKAEMEARNRPWYKFW